MKPVSKYLTSADIAKMHCAVEAGYSWDNMLTTWQGVSESTIRRFMKKHIPEAYAKMAPPRRPKMKLDELPVELCEEIYRLHKQGHTKSEICVKASVSKKVVERAILNVRESIGLGSRQ